MALVWKWENYNNDSFIKDLDSKIYQHRKKRYEISERIAELEEIKGLVFANSEEKEAGSDE